MSSNVQQGKAFEFALIQRANEMLSQITNTELVHNSSLEVAREAYHSFDEIKKNAYTTAATTSILHLIQLEPRLQRHLDRNDKLQLSLQSDNVGENGDVRDLIFIRSSQDWEIGVSAKNNHLALKNSRLSRSINFGEKWIGVPCHQGYFEQIEDIFLELQVLRAERRLWRDIDNKANRFYVPLLQIFKQELQQLLNENPDRIPLFLKYILGRKDFYKVIKRRREVTIQAFNVGNTLGKNIGNERSISNIPRLQLPSRVSFFDFKQNSRTTLILELDAGWQLSFRIHSAALLVETSLKFDVQLIGLPQSMYTTRLAV